MAKVRTPLRCLEGGGRRKQLELALHLHLWESETCESHKSWPHVRRYSRRVRYNSIFSVRETARSAPPTTSSGQMQQLMYHKALVKELRSGAARPMAIRTVDEVDEGSACRMPAEVCLSPV